MCNYDYGVKVCLKFLTNSSCVFFLSIQLLPRKWEPDQKQGSRGGEVLRRPHSASSTTSYDSSDARRTTVRRGNEKSRKDPVAQKDYVSRNAKDKTANGFQRAISMPVMPVSGHLSDISERSNEPTSSRIMTHEEQAKNNNNINNNVDSQATSPETISPAPRKVSIAPEALIPPSHSTTIQRVPTPGAPSTQKQQQQTDKGNISITQRRGSKENLLDEHG